MAKRDQVIEEQVEVIALMPLTFPDKTIQPGETVFVGKQVASILVSLERAEYAPSSTTQEEG